MNDLSSPQMSVVLVTPDNYGTIRKTIKHLRAQTVRERLEIVIVAPSQDRLDIDVSDMKDFFRFQVVEVGEVRLMTKVKAAAVRETNAPIVAFAEDHCYPEPGWAEALIAAHQEGYAAVGPVMGNANPGTMLSWAGLFMHFGPYFEPTTTGVTKRLPWHNVSYKRQLLLDYGDRLAWIMIIEGFLLDDLRGKGHRLYLEPAAKTNHINISSPSSWIRHAFWGGWLFGAIRAREQEWSPWRRILYILGAQLIPLVRVCRTIKEIYRADKQKELIPQIIPALISGLLPHAIGELIGYAFGLGNAEERYSHYEMARIRHLVPEDCDLVR